jgi:NDP-4-keto-2,6-dideoxyhexose 3-C-methyltransferase
MFGNEYGYRSGLNSSMVRHLERKAQRLSVLANLRWGDTILDIGSNDGTLLKSYPRSRSLNLVGIDPTGEQFKGFYPRDIELISDFFSARAVRERIPIGSLKIVTSVAMFYDLERPTDFAREVEDVMADDGIWHFEQSYMPKMLSNTSYDTVCHEHLEYYAMKQIHWIMDKVGLKVVDLDFNEINGGSFAVTVAKRASRFKECRETVKAVLDQEHYAGLDTMSPYSSFRRRVMYHKREVATFLGRMKRQGKKVLGLGASTKGNVILQYCDITREEIPFIGDVNPQKHGSYTPGTSIPIIPEDEVIGMRPDYFLVLPWHFREFFEKSRGKYGNSKLVFPLPDFAID